MNIIDPTGLFEGERLAACSDLAQLNWPRLYLASNGYGRLELSYNSIISNAYRGFKNPPTEDALWGFFEEFATNFLAILYQADSAWWAEFVTSQKYLPRYKTTRDDRSPAPPLELLDKHRSGYIEWKKAKSFMNQRFQKFSESLGNVPNISAAVAVAVAVAVAGADAIAEEKDSCAHVSDEPSAGAVFHLPLKDGSEYGLQGELYAEFCKAYPAVKVMEQLPAMRAWLLSNPGKRKTRSGIKAFINRWLSRERDKPDGASRNRSPRAESFAAIDYQKSYGLAPGEHVGLI